MITSDFDNVIGAIEKRYSITFLPRDYARINKLSNIYSTKQDGGGTSEINIGEAYKGGGNKLLSPAKQICEEWASLIINEDLKLTTSDTFSGKETFETFLKENDVMVKMSQCAELAFATGISALTVESINNDVSVTCYNAMNIFPISVNRNNDITEVAFILKFVVNGDDRYYAQLHLVNSAGGYIVRDLYLDKERKIIESETIEIMPKQKLFAIFKPNIFRIEKNVMGTSIYEYSLDVITSLNNAYTSLNDELVLGRKTKFISQELLKYYDALDSNGKMLSTVKFDPSSSIFVLGAQSNLNAPPILQEHNGELRVDKIIQTIVFNLEILGKQCELGSDYFRKSVVATTATEIIAKSQEVYRNREKHYINLKKFIKDLLIAWNALNPISVNVNDIIITLPDNVITDTNTDKMIAMQEVSAGVISKAEYRSMFFGETIEQATEQIKAIDEQKRLTQPQLEYFDNE